MSSDIRDLGRTYSTRLSVTGDIKPSLQALQPLLMQEAQPREDAYAVLRQQRLDLQHTRRRQLEARAASQWPEAVITPLVAAQQVIRAIPSHVAIVDEAIATSLHVRSFLNSRNAKQYSFLRGGALGWGMPAAVGCSLGLGREPVVCLIGDGAALYSPQALWTAAHERLPVTFVVMNNREYNVLKNFLKRQPDYLSVKTQQFIAMDIVDPAIDYLALSRSMGVAAVRVHRAADVSAAIEAGIASRSPNLVEIVIGTEEK